MTSQLRPRQLKSRGKSPGVQSKRTQTKIMDAESFLRLMKINQPRSELISLLFCICFTLNSCFKETMNQLPDCKTQHRILLLVLGVAAPVWCLQKGSGVRADVRRALLQHLDDRRTKRQRWAADSRTIINAIKSDATAWKTRFRGDVWMFCCDGTHPANWILSAYFPSTPWGLQRGSSSHTS